MKRLTLWTVWAGSSRDRARAERPTIAVPSSLTCTTEGTSAASPSMRSTSGRPSFQIAGRELVVPRSMPMTTRFGDESRTSSSM